MKEPKPVHAGRDNYPICAPRPHKHYPINVPTLTPEQWHATDKNDRCTKCTAIINNRMEPEYER